MGPLDLMQEATFWVDIKEYAGVLKGRFTEYVNADPELDGHRTYIEKRAYGMGERCFHWLWKLIVDEMPDEFSFLEIGVYKGQVLSLVKLLAGRVGKLAHVTGVTLLSSFAGETGKFPAYPDEDYLGYITDLHDRFDLKQPSLIVGSSIDERIQELAEIAGPYDVIYIDGCHEYDYVVQDLRFYPTLLKPGGLLVLDDASNYLKQPFGFFQGIEDVSRAVRTVIEIDPAYEHLFALVHNRVWRKLS